tara:strand:- start:46 stop:246 length:201 start_codon:yes stop_codon:yes gene_type:complete
MSLKGFRKRILVTEGDLYTLFKEVQQIRKVETKELYNTKFRALLKDAEFVNFKITPKKDNHGSTDK